MSNKFKYAALGAAFALTVGAAPALAQDGAPVPEATSSELEYQGEIEIWNTMRDFELQELQKVIDAWEAANPGVTVKHTPVSFDDLRPNFLNAAPTGQGVPDIIRSEAGWTVGFADEGFLLDLSSLIDTSDFLPEPISTAEWKGGLYGVPHVWDFLGLQCNAEALASVGLDAPPATFDELVAAGTEFADVDAQKYGFNIFASDAYYSQPHIWSWGGELFEVNEDGSVSVLINSPESAAGWNYIRDNMQGVIMPAIPDITNEWDNQIALFTSGNAMCVIMGPWGVAPHLAGEVFKDNPENLVIAPMPEGSPGNAGTPIGGHHWAVYALVAEDAAKQTAVLDLIEFMNGSEAQAYLATSLGLIPTRASALESEIVASDPLVAPWAAVAEDARNRGGHPRAGDIYVDLGREWQAFLTGQKSAEDALATIEAAWEGIFNG
jgi:ABC-type glycerol-3-phosphate transport system substrate-binding protein